MDPYISQIKGKLAKYCAYQERCVYDVHTKLERMEVPFEMYDSFIEWLQEEKFLDEQRYVEHFVRSKFNLKHWGRKKIYFELSKRRIDKNLIHETIQNEIDYDEYLEKIKLLISKKRLDTSVKKEKDKLIFYLQQKGYEFGPILEALDSKE